MNRAWLDPTRIPWSFVAGYGCGVVVTLLMILIMGGK
jgi:hypothetical protein